MTATALEPGLAEELRAIVGEEGVLTSRSSLYNRARVPAPFPVHRWDEHLPDVVVLPRSTEHVAAIVRLGNRYRTPMVARAGGTGLADGAVPVRGGICVDVKLMDEVKEIDLEDYTVTVGPGINMQTLNRKLARHGVIYPDDPASYACALIGGRIGTGGWSLLGTRYGHVRDLVISFEIVLPTGDVVRVGEGGTKKVRKSSIGYSFKHLFMGHQGTLGIVTEATLELVPKAEAQFSAFFVFPSFDEAFDTMRRLARSGLSTLAGVMIFDPEKVEFLRRDDEAYVNVPDWVQGVVGVALMGARCEVEPSSKVCMQIGRSLGGKFMGDEISAMDWACRHDRYATPLHGRDKAGQVVAMDWHCEDATAPFSQLRPIREKWHAIAARYVAEYEIFDEWGVFAYTNGPHKPWGDVLMEIDMGIIEERLDEVGWQAFVKLKQEIATVVIEHGGSMSGAHGGTRAGDRELVPVEMGPGQWELMKKVKRMLDPLNLMNPGKQMLDEAYVADA